MLSECNSSLDAFKGNTKATREKCAGTQLLCIGGAGPVSSPWWYMVVMRGGALWTVTERE